MRNTVILVVSVCILTQGCATFDGLAARRNDADAFLAQTAERTAAVLADDIPFDLDRCIAVALDNNFDIKSVALEKRIAKLNRRIAFANFLPEITMDYTHMELNEAPASAIFGSMTTTVQDRIVRDTAVNAQMPIFAPATWFLYAIHRRGEEISGVVEDYTAQMIALQVTGQYFQCLATGESRRILEAQHNAALALAKEVAAYHSEGMVTDADMARVRVLVMAREAALEQNGRAEQRALADLLTGMGLAPTARIELATTAHLDPPEGELEDWILQALLSHPRLAVADQAVEIEREKARIALTNFLPALAGFASRSHTSNSYMAYPYASAFGFAGVMTVFNGFANVNEYRVARTEEEKAFLKREQESLALMLEVVRARTHLADADTNLNLAEAAAAAAEIALREDTAKMHEGLLRPSEMLDAVAERDTAVVNAANARYQKEVMTAIARNVVGATYRGCKETNDE